MIYDCMSVLKGVELLLYSRIIGWILKHIHALLAILCPVFMFSTSIHAILYTNAVALYCGKCGGSIGQVPATEVTHIFFYWISMFQTQGDV